MKFIIEKIFMTFCFVVSSSCYHVFHTAGKDEMDFVELAKKSNKKELPELVYMNDGIINDMESLETPEDKFYDTLEEENERKIDKSAKRKTSTPTQPINIDDDDIFGSSLFNEAFEKEMKRREQLLSRLQDQSKRIARIQHEMRRQHKEIKNIEQDEDRYDKKEDFWTGVCRISKTILRGFFNFFGIKM